MTHTNHGLIGHDDEPDVTHETTEEQKNEQAAEKPYSIYTYSEKWFLVAIGCLAGLFR